MYTHIVTCICVRFFTSQHAHLGFIGIAEYLFYMIVLVVAVVMVFYNWQDFFLGWENVDACKR